MRENCAGWLMVVPTRRLDLWDAAQELKRKGTYISRLGVA
jgi:hypothetical protein